MGRRGYLAGIVAMAACLVLPSGASARILRAESVMAPGQSGFVSVAGVLSGTGSSHLNDQVPLFQGFRYRPATFDQPGNTETPRPGVRITRDGYGVPDVHGTSERDAWWGAGYAVAQDRLFQLELFRRAAAGRLAEVLGSSYLGADYVARRDYYTGRELDAQLARLPAPLLDRLRSYRDGVNAWIDRASLDPANLPGEFVALGILPIQHWTLRDSAGVGVLLARTVPSGDGTELLNARALELMGRKRFDRLLPIHSVNSRVTIPASEGLFPSDPGRSAADEQAGFKRSRDYLAHVRLPSDISGSVGLSSTSSNPLFRLVTHPGGSFMWAMRDPANRRAFLYNGPQLGFSIPELLVELEIHYPGQPGVRGVTAAGLPVIGIGHNTRVAWGFTSGESDDDDLYAEHLTGPESYSFRGQSRAMSCRTETFSWRPPVTSLPGLILNPGLPAGVRSRRICRTDHGPIQAQAGSWAFARRYAIWGRELQSLVGLSELNDAKDIQGVNRTVAHVTWNENVIAADSGGHIGYWHPGLLPVRPRRWDERLPYPGQGQAEWRGFLPVAKRPRVIDPASGWVANWNNQPSAAWTNGDGGERGRLNGRLHRVRLVQARVAHVAQHPTYRRSRAIVRRTGTTAQQAPFVDRGKLHSALGAHPGAGGKRVLRIIGRWDGSYVRTDPAGTVQPGVAIWQQFKRQMELRLFSTYGPGAKLLAGEVGSFHLFDASAGQTDALNLLGPTAYAAAARQTAAVLTKRFGSADPTRWRQPRRLYEISAMGAAAAPEFPFLDRGTWEQSISVGK